MSNAEAKQLRGSRQRRPANSQAAAVDTQISKFFPKSADPTDPAGTRAGRKRAAAVPVDLAAASDSDDERLPSTSSAKQHIEAAKRTLREKIQSTVQPKISDKQKDTMISKFFERNQDDEDDDDDMAFETPKPKPKPQAKVATKRTRVVKPKQTAAAKSKQPSAKNMIRERFFSDVMAQHSARDGVDSDELQMALALSRSMAQQSQQQEPSADHAAMSAAANPKAKNATKEKAVFEIFQNFGFREGYKEFDPADFVTKPKVARKCNRYASKVTALTRRLNAVQLQKLRARLAYIGRHCVRPMPDTPAPCAVYQMASEYLARFYIPQRDLVELNGTADRQPLAAFYTNNLCEVSAVRAGALLRNWAEIPGRDRSPQREDADADRPMLSCSLPTGDPADGAIQSSADAEIITVSGESAEVAEILDSVANSHRAAEQPTEPITAAPQSNNSSLNETKRCASRASRQTRYWTAALDRSASPDMFASDSDGEGGVAGVQSRPETTSPPSSPFLSSDPAKCSLDPESTTNEEDRLIDLYDQVARIRRLTHTPSVNVVAQSSSSSDETIQPSVAPVLDSVERTSLQLFYSGDSEQESQCHALASSADGGGTATAVPQESSSSFVTAGSSEHPVGFDTNGNDGPLVRTDINGILSSPDEFEDAAEVQATDLKQEPSVSFGCSQEPIDSISDDELSVGQTLVVDACNNTALDVLPQKCASSQSSERAGISALERFDVSDEAKICDDNRDTVSPIIIELSDNSEPMAAMVDSNPAPMPIQTEVSTDNIDFSFDSIASDLEATFQRPPSTVRQLGLNRQLLEKSITSKLTEKSRIIESIELSDDEDDHMPDAQTERFVIDRSCNLTEENASLNAFVQCLNQSHCSETKYDENEETEYTSEDKNERLPISEHICKNTEENTSLNALVQCLNQSNSIEISDDEDNDRQNPTDDVNFSFPSQVDQQFEFSVNLSYKPRLNSVTNKSIEISDDDISDDEINYSMSHGRSDLPTRTPCRQSRAPQPVNNINISCTNESLQHIFDDDDGFDTDADKADEALLNQSVQTIVRHEFVAQSSARKQALASQRVSSGTKLRRYMSDVSGTSLAKATTAPKSPAIIEADDDVDEFDRMVCPKLREQQTQKPKPKPRLIQTFLSPPKATDLKFTVTYDQRTYDVKIGPRCVTPKPDFEAMDSPTRDAQLRRFGLTQLSKRRAIICLEHIYNRMHPFVQVTDGVLTREYFESTGIAEAVQQSRSEGIASTKAPPTVKSKVVAAAAMRAAAAEPAEPDDEQSGLQLFAVANPSIADTLPYDFFVYFLNQQSDYYLPSQPRGKRPWCLQPLHIAWYNMLHDNPRAYEHVLQYRPIELRTVRTHFKELGMLYDVNDLIAFFDKHCITFRTESTRTKRNASKK